MAHIRSRRAAADPPPISDYAAARASFRWETVAEELGVPLAGPLNLGSLALHAPPDRPALRWFGARGEEETLSYGDLAAAAGRFANLLKNLGVSRGDRVLFLTRPLPETVFGVLGSLLFGAVPCVLALHRSPEYMQNVLTRTGAKLLVVEPESKRWIDPLRKTLPDLGHVVVLQRATLNVKMGPGDFLWNDCFDSASTAFSAVPCTANSPAFLHYTDLGMSGATCTHAAAFALRHAARVALDLREGDDCLLLAHPGDMHYVPIALLAPLLAEATQILLEDPVHFSGYGLLAESRGVRVWYSAFPALEVLLRNNPSLAELLRSLRHIAVAHPVDDGFVQMTSQSYGSPLHGVWWERQFGSIVLAEFPGLDLRPGSLGRPLPGIEVATRDGFLAVRLGPGVPFGGFWGDAAQTSKSVREGWFVTAQPAVVDAEGYCRPVTQR